MIESEIKCPHCGYESDVCDFSDIYYDFSEKKAECQEQYKLLLKQLQDLGYNVVYCGWCGNAIITRS